MRSNERKEAERFVVLVQGGDSREKQTERERKNGKKNRKKASSGKKPYRHEEAHEGSRRKGARSIRRTMSVEGNRSRRANTPTRSAKTLQFPLSSLLKTSRITHVGVREN